VIQDALFELGSGGSAAGSSTGGIDARSAALGALSNQVPRRRPMRRAERGKQAPPPDELTAVTALAANAGVSFYTWKGQGNVGGVAAEVGGDAALGLTPDVVSDRESSLAASLAYLADDTGGKGVVGGTVDTLMQEAVAGFGGFYSLGFSPEHGGDDRLHELKVKVKGRGLRVWYPKMYIARPPADPAASEALTGESDPGGS
ncbi:MAG: hypothetical protein MI919_11150, partial [Holophagales bacterium]|nr:hypothetical protein [Holophagales bacterium]